MTFPSARDTTRPPGGWPRISIVTPNYNYAQTLETTIQSVVGQGYPQLEYIVIDDGSTDSSIDILSRHANHLAHWETQQNAGQYPALNKGFGLGSGDIVGWLNSDDILFPWSLQAVGEIFATFPEVQWISARPTRITNGIPREVMPTRLYPQRMLQLGLFDGHPFGWVQQESTFWRRSLMQTAGLLDTSLRYAADFEWWSRFARHAELYSVDFPIGGFWDHGSNRSIANITRYQAEVEQVQQAMGTDAGNERRRIEAAWNRFSAVKQFTGLRGLARRLGGLDTLTSHVIGWDNNSRTYTTHTRSLADSF